MTANDAITDSESPKRTQRALREHMVAKENRVDKDDRDIAYW